MWLLLVLHRRLFGGGKDHRVQEGGGMAYEAFRKANLMTPFYDGHAKALTKSFCIALVYISQLEITIVKAAWSNHIARITGEKVQWN